MTENAQPLAAPPSSHEAQSAAENAVRIIKQTRSIADCMAVERTIMANERTLLAYVRTALAVLVVGVTIIKFFSSQGMLILGYFLLGAGIACVTIGLMRFTEMHHRLSELNMCEGEVSIGQNKTS